LSGSEELVWSLLSDLEHSRLEEKEKALLRFVDKVSRDSPGITAADMEPPYAVGLDDEAIYFAVTVCALFNFYNRRIDATGVHEMSPEVLHGAAHSGSSSRNRSIACYSDGRGKFGVGNLRMLILRHG
jgi:hypothetical protein